MPPERGIHNFLKVTRAKVTRQDKHVRIVYISEIIREKNGQKLEAYLAERIPFYYRDLNKIKESLGSGYFVNAIKETLAKLPTSESFIESHCGEIAAGIFAEEVLGLKKIYSKLTGLTAENANAFKMDLLLYKPESNPIEFVFGEVKSSHKTAASGFPAGHDKSCYADIFNSLREYTEADVNFDLTTLKDNLDRFEPVAERERLREALKPYGAKKISYTGFAIIDSSTRHDDEVSVLAKRKSEKNFDVDLLCVEGFPDVAAKAYNTLAEIRGKCS